MSERTHLVTLPFDTTKERQTAVEFLDLLAANGDGYVAVIQDRGPIGGLDLVVEVN